MFYRFCVANAKWKGDSARMKFYRRLMEFVKGFYLISMQFVINLEFVLIAFNI